MISGIHDSYLVGYEVNANRQRLSLSIEPKTDSPASFKVGFEGVEAHLFLAPLLPAILDGIYRVDAADLVRAEWAHFVEGYKRSGWPGPWGANLEDALSFVQSSELSGFRVESSYGLSGWVLAKSVSKLGRRIGPNNSFKPKPLRGSA